MPACKLTARPFYITVAGTTISFEISGSLTDLAYKKIRHTFLDFSSINRRPRYKIIIKCETNKTKPEFIRKENVLSVRVWDRFIHDSVLWPVFIDNLVTHIYKFILSRDNMMMLHAAACARGDKGYLFLGPSGSGKTTVARASKRYSVLSDEKVFVECQGRKILLYSMPLLNYESERLHDYASGGILLDKIFILKKSGGVKVEKLSRGRAMISIIHRAADLRSLIDQDIKKVFNLSYKIVLGINAYNLYFSKDAAFWEGIS